MLFHKGQDPGVFLGDFLYHKFLPPRSFFRWGPSLKRSSSSLSRISFVLGGVAPFFMAYEAHFIPHVLCPLARSELDSVHVHGIGVSDRSSSDGRGNVLLSSPQPLDSNDVPVKLACLVQPLFPLPSGLFLASWEGSSSHHHGELIGHPSLEGIY